MSTEQQKSIGAIWERDGKGGPYLSGEIEIDGQKVRFVAFRNRHKKEQKHPDWRILPSQERGGSVPPESQKRTVTLIDESSPVPF